MNYSSTQGCPNRDCDSLNTIYIMDSEMPRMHTWYQYTCPKCNKEIACQVGAVTIEQSQPKGAIVAKIIINK